MKGIVKIIIWWGGYKGSCKEVRFIHFPIPKKQSDDYEMYRKTEYCWNPDKEEVDVYPLIMVDNCIKFV